MIMRTLLRKVNGYAKSTLNSLPPSLRAWCKADAYETRVYAWSRYHERKGWCTRKTIWKRTLMHEKGFCIPIKIYIVMCSWCPRTSTFITLSFSCIFPPLYNGLLIYLWCPRASTLPFIVLFTLSPCISCLPHASAFQKQRAIALFSIIPSLCMSPPIDSPWGKLMTIHMQSLGWQPTLCCLMSDLVICKFRYNMVIHVLTKTRYH